MNEQEKNAIMGWIAISIANYVDMFNDDCAIIEIASQASKMVRDRRQSREELEKKIAEAKKQMKEGEKDGN